MDTRVDSLRVLCDAIGLPVPNDELSVLADLYEEIMRGGEAVRRRMAGRRDIPPILTVEWTNT